jgi:hypothetical protein
MDWELDGVVLANPSLVGGCGLGGVGENGRAAEEDELLWDGTEGQLSDHRFQHLSHNI